MRGLVLGQIQRFKFRCIAPATQLPAHARFSRFGLQIDSFEQGLVELGVVVACPGKEGLVKVALGGGDAIDAGDLHAHELQRGQLVDGRERKRRRGDRKSTRVNSSH